MIYLKKKIKSCKVTNLEFLKLKEKLGLCLYEDICDEKEFILMSEESFMQHDIENKQLKEENKKINVNENENENGNEKLKTRNEKAETRNEKRKLTNENEQFKKNIVKEEPKEIKSSNWLDKNKFKENLTIINSNKFGYKNKIGDFKYIDIKDLVINIKDNAISEIDAKKHLSTLNKIKNAEIKHKRLIPGQKELLNLFNGLSDIILTDKTLMPSKNKNEKLKEENENENENENEDDETMDQEDLKGYYTYNDYDDKELKSEL